MAGTTARPGPRFHAAGLILVMAAAAAVYWNTLGHGFVWDDHILIEGSAFVQDPGNARTLASVEFFRAPMPIEGSARPMMLLSLLADRAVGGANPRGYHRTNILLHACASGAFYALTAAAVGAPALAAGLLFAVHPVNSEAVNLVSFRADIMAALFAFLALLFYLNARRGQGLARWAWLLACAAAYGLALLSKEMAITMPALAGLWELTLGRREPRAKAVWAAAALLLAGVSLAYLSFRGPRSEYKGIGRSAVLEALRPDLAAAPAPAALAPAVTPARTADDPSPPPWSVLYGDGQANARTMGVVGARYVGLLAWPVALRADRAPELFESWLRPAVLLSWVLLAALLAAGGVLAARGGAGGWILGWLFLSLAPVSNVLPLYNPIAERYLYFVCPAAAWALAAGLGRLPRKLGAATLCAVLAAFAARTVLRNPDWSSDQAFVDAELRRGSPSARILYNAGLLSRKSGDLKAARAYYERALALHPGYMEAAANLAAVLDELGDKSQAAAQFKRAEQLGWKPGSFQRAQVHERLGRTRQAVESYLEAGRADPAARPQARDAASVALINAGVSEHQSGRLDAAGKLLSEAVTLAPREPSALHNLAKVRVDQERLDEARGLLERAAKAAPRDAQVAYDLAVVRHRLGDLPGAEAGYRRVLGLAERLEALHNLSGLLESSGRLDEAERFARRAAVLAPLHGGPQTVLGNIYLKRKQPERALEFYRAALRAAQAPGEPPEAVAIAQANLQNCLKNISEASSR